MTKRVSSLVLAIVMLLQMLVPQTTIAKEGVKAPSDNLVKVGLINSNSYDSKLMLELNRLTAKSRGKRSAEPGTRLFGYFDEGQDPKDEDKLKYHGEVKAELSVKGLDGNPFQWKEIFGTEELHLRFIQMNDDTGVETGTERVLNITQAGTYTWTDGDGEPAELPLFNNKLEPLTYEVKLDEEVSDKVKLLTARFTTTGNAGSPTFEKPDADGRIKYHLTLEIGLQQVASSKFVSEWHTAVGESDRPQLVGTMTGSMVSGKSKTININLPTNDDAEVIVRTASRRDKNKFLPEFLFKKPTVKLVETNENDLAFDTTNKTVTSGDHKFKYDFTYDVINGGKLTMTEILPVTFDANGGKFENFTAPDTETKIFKEVNYEKDVTAPKAPTKEGETFIGWGDKAEATTPVMADAFKGIKEAKTFYAIFTKDIIEQKDNKKPDDVPAGHVKVTVDVTDKAKLGEDENQTRIFWVDPKKEVTLPVTKPTGKDVPVDGTNPKAYTWVFTKWTSDEAAPRTWSDGITATFPKETTITANYDKNITDQGTVEGKGITVHESYKDGETWVNNFIPEANTLKAAVKVKDTNGNEEDLPEGATVELVDDGGAPYADEAALTNALYDKLQEKANPNDEPTRVETVKAKVTFKNGEVQIVDIPIKVIKNIYEAKTETKPPYYVPKDYVKVTLDPTNKAQDPQKTYYYVNPKAQVVIPENNPVGEGDNQFTKWLIDGTTEEYKLADKPRHQFKNETTIKAQYVSDVIPQEGTTKPDTVPTNYVEVKFVPTDKATDTSEKIYWVNPDKEVTIPVTDPKGATYYTFKEWKIGEGASGDKYVPTTPKKFEQATTVTATYDEAKNIIPYDPSVPDPMVRPEGYVRVTFAADPGLKLTEQKAYYVKANAGITLGNEDLVKPAYKEETGYKFEKWDQEDTVEIIETDIVVTAKATKLDNVIPEKDNNGNNNTKPEGYKEVTFVIKDDDKTKGSLEGVTKFYVNPTKYVTINPPTTTANTGFEFGAWGKDTKIPTVYDKDTTITGTFNGLGNVIPKTNPDGSENKKPDGYKTVTFVLEKFKGNEVGRFNDEDITVYYVNPEKEVYLRTPTPIADTGYKFNFWSPSVVKKKYAEDTTIKGYFKKLEDIIPGDQSKPDGYVTAIFVKGQHGTLSGQTVYYVNPNAGITRGKLTEPTVEPQTGYVFDKWSIDKDAPINADRSTYSIEAYYNEIPDVVPKMKDDGTENKQPEGYITVTFVKGDHGKELTGQAVYYVNPNKAVVLEGKAPTAVPNTGYQFARWDTTIDKAIQYKDGDKITALYNKLGDISTTEVEGYVKVKFNPGTNGSLEGTQVYWIKPGVEVNIPAPTVNPNVGYKFDKWDKSLTVTAKANDPTYEITAQYAPLDNIVPGDQTKPEGYVTITFKAENGSLSGTTTYYVNPNETVDLTDKANGLGKKADVGYTADGGTWTPAIASKKYTENAEYTFKFKKLDDVIPATEGQTMPEGYVTVKFLAGLNGALEGGDKIYYVNPKANVIIGGKDIPVPKTNPEKDYEFNKWLPEIDKTSSITRDQTHVAQFVYNPATVTLTYEAKDATSGEVPGAQTVKKGNAVILAGAKTLKKDNATLWGWEIDGTKHPIGASITLEKDSMATAVWTTNSHTVDFDTKGGTHVPPRTVEHGKPIGQINPPTKPGSTFTGWTTSDGKPFIPETDLVTSGITLEANYVPNVIPETGNGKPDNVPKNFVPVTVDPTDKATDPTTQVFWVNPNEVVQIPAKQPTGKKEDKITYVFDSWNPSLIGTFNTPTTITAKYREQTPLTPIFDPRITTGVVATDLNKQPPLEAYRDQIKSGSHKEFDLVKIVEQPKVNESGFTSAKIKIRFTENDMTQVVDVLVYVKPDPVIIEKPYPVPGDCNNSCDQPNQPNKPGESNKPNQPNIGMDALNTTDHYQYLIGYPDGNFAPNRGMTRAEVATMFTRLLKERPVKGQRYYTGFSDIQAGDWYANTVGYAVQVGIVSGYPDGSFKPNKPITRAEFASIASRFDALAQGNNIAFNDLAPSHWGYNAIRSAASKGWISGYPDNTFRPEKAISRAEVTSITNRMLNRYADLYWIDAHRGEVIRFGDVNRSDWYFEPIMEATMGHDFIRDRDGKTEHWSGINGKSFI